MLYKTKLKLCVFSALMITIITAAVYLSKTHDFCSNEIYGEYLAPDKVHKAVVFNRDCGATTDFNTQLSVLLADEEPTKGNALIVGSHYPSEPTKVTWLDEQNLEVLIPQHAKVYHQNAVPKDGVHLHFQVSEIN
jgi:hypothetical protein